MSFTPKYSMPDSPVRDILLEADQRSRRVAKNLIHENAEELSLIIGLADIIVELRAELKKTSSRKPEKRENCCCDFSCHCPVHGSRPIPSWAKD